MVALRDRACWLVDRLRPSKAAVSFVVALHEDRHRETLLDPLRHDRVARFRHRVGARLLPGTLAIADVSHERRVEAELATIRAGHRRCGLVDVVRSTAVRHVDDEWTIDAKHETVHAGANPIECCVDERRRALEDRRALDAEVDAFGGCSIRLQAGTVRRRRPSDLLVTGDWEETLVARRRAVVVCLQNAPRDEAVTAPQLLDELTKELALARLDRPSVTAALEALRRWLALAIRRAVVVRGLDAARARVLPMQRSPLLELFDVL